MTSSRRGPNDPKEDSGIFSKYVRPEVLRLAVVMERLLRKNDWKGGWGQLAGRGICYSGL